MQDIKSTTEKWTFFASHFDGHSDQVLRCRAHRPVKQIWGYPRCHWTPPSGEYSPRIAPADAMVIDFGIKNRVVALWKSLFEASVLKAGNGPSTHQLIEATSCVERWNATIKADELAYFSSYQTLRMDKNHRSYQSPKKLVK